MAKMYVPNWPEVKLNQFRVVSRSSTQEQMQERLKLCFRLLELLICVLQDTRKQFAVC